MTRYRTSQLDEARALRALKLDQTTALLTACTCAYPIVRYRNGHGHDSACPAVEVWNQLRGVRTDDPFVEYGRARGGSDDMESAAARADREAGEEP